MTNDERVQLAAKFIAAGIVYEGLARTDPMRNKVAELALDQADALIRTMQKRLPRRDPAALL